MKNNYSTRSRLHQAKTQSGFTLVEMLVVIGIIGILAVSMLGSFGYLKTAAWKSRAQSQVSHVAAALTLHLQEKRSWPDELLNKKEFDEEACAILQRYQLVDVTTWKKLPTDETAGDINKESPDRYGLLDPWGRSIMRKNPSSAAADVQQHRLQYRLDKDFDGYVDASEGSPKGVRVRCSVLVWSRGPDGYDDADGKNPKAKRRYPYDDSLSWNFGGSTAEAN